MQKYNTYKPSNIEWLGDVPSHWKVSEIKHDLEFTTGFTPPTSNAELFDGDITWVTIADMDQKYISNSKTKLTAEAVANAKAQIIPKGSLLYSFKLSIGKVAFAETDLYTNEAIACFLPNVKFNPNFLYYAFETYLHNYGKENIYGALLLNREIIKAAKITYPKFTEQTAIAAYLDQATANIDKVIATKQKQLEKLEQYKQSKIHECVTKGLNPDVTLKPSGIDWIGNVPSHWKVERLKYVVSKIGSGVTPKGGATVYQTTGIPLIRSQNVHFDGLDFSDIACITEEIHDDMSSSKVKRGDVLLNITGASIGRCYYYDLDDEANVNQHVCILRPNDLMTTNFLYYLMMSEVGQSQIFSGFKGSGREGLGNEAIKVFKIPLPKTKEQKEISYYLDFFCDNIKKGKSIIEQQIEKLKQYRKCLIHECVTGKRKVIKD